MSTHLDRTVSPRPAVAPLVVPPAVARLALATVVLLAALLVALLVVQGVASQAGPPSGHLHRTPGVVVTPHPQPAGS